MCVVALSLLTRPRWPVILIGNRDEFHARASAPLRVWDDGSGIIGGRDLVGGGTWLGINPAAARVAVITNVRSDDGPDPAKRSRGELVTGALTGAADIEDADAYNGFSLLTVTGTTATLTSNRPGAFTQQLAVGQHAIANRPLSEACLRADRLATALGALDDDALADNGALFALLRDGHDWPYTPGGDAPVQAFLTDALYGTRCSTIVRVGGDGRGVIAERRYDGGGNPTGDTVLAFNYS